MENLTPIRGVLFDLDGILLDTERMYAEADRRAAREMGYEIPETVVHSLCGANAQLVRQTVMTHFGPDFDYETYHALAKGHMAALLKGGVPEKPGARPLLAWLRQQRYRVALATMSGARTAEKLLGQVGFLGYFDALRFGDMVENSKPAPDIFISAAEALGLAPAHCAAVEDSHNGVRSAAAAGCQTLMVPDLQPATEEMAALCSAVLPDLFAVQNYLAARQKDDSPAESDAPTEG